MLLKFQETRDCLVHTWPVAIYVACVLPKNRGHFLGEGMLPTQLLTGILSNVLS